MRALIVFIISGLFGLVSGCGAGPNAPTSAFAGKITGTDAIAVTKVIDINRKKVEIVGRINVAPDGTFEAAFENIEPHLYELNFPNGKKIQFVTDGTKPLEFEGDAANPDAIKITGSAENREFAKYETFRKESLQRLVRSVREQIANFPDKSSPEFERLGKLEVTNYVKHKQELLDYVTKNMGSSLAVYPTSVRWPADPEAIRPVVASFEKAHPDWAVTKRLKEKLAVVEQTAIGGTAPDIRMRDGTGTEISLYSSKGTKYTLVDFWGSWCGPCRREAQTLGELYSKYKPMGFEIYGVALEKEMTLWKNAKDQDKRVWPNVLSLKEFETEAAYDYAVSALPANFLIDSDGKVVAKDLHDEALATKLKELFGE